MVVRKTDRPDDAPGEERVRDPDLPHDHLQAGARRAPDHAEALPVVQGSALRMGPGRPVRLQGRLTVVTRHQGSGSGAKQA